MSRGINVLEQSMNRMSQVQAETGMIFSNVFNNIEAARQTINQRDLEEETIRAQQSLISSYDENQYDSDAFGQAVQDQKSLIGSNKSLSRKVKRQLLRNVDQKSFELDRNIRQNTINLNDRETFLNITDNASNTLLSTYDNNPENTYELTAEYEKQRTLIQNSGLQPDSMVNALATLDSEFNNLTRSIQSNVNQSEIKNRDSQINRHIHSTLSLTADQNPKDLDAFKQVTNELIESINRREDISGTEKQEFEESIRNQAFNYERGIRQNIDKQRRQNEIETLGYEAQNLQDQILEKAARDLDLDQEAITDFVRVLEDLDYTEAAIENELKKLNENATMAMFQSEVNSILSLNMTYDTVDDIDDAISTTREMFEEIVRTEDSGLSTLKRQDLEIKLNNQIQTLNNQKNNLLNADTKLNENIEAGLELIGSGLAENRKLNEEDVNTLDNLVEQINQSGNPQYKEHLDNLLKLREFNMKTPQEQRNTLTELNRAGDFAEVKKLAPIHRNLFEQENNDLVEFHMTHDTGFNIQGFSSPYEIADKNILEERINTINEIGEIRGIPEENRSILSQREAEAFNEWFKHEDTSDEQRLDFLERLPLNDKLLNELDFADSSGVTGFLIAESKRGHNVPVGVLTGADIDKDVIFRHLPRNSVEQNLHAQIRKQFPYPTINDLNYYTEMALNNAAYEIQKLGMGRDIDDKLINEQVEKSIKAILPKKITNKIGIYGFRRDIEFVSPHAMHTLNAYDTISNIAPLLKDANAEAPFLTSFQGIDKEFSEFKSNGSIIGNTDILLGRIRNGSNQIVPVEYNYKGEKTNQRWYQIRQGNGFITNEAGEIFQFTIPVQQEKVNRSTNRVFSGNIDDIARNI